MHLLVGVVSLIHVQKKRGQDNEKSWFTSDTGSWYTVSDGNGDSSEDSSDDDNDDNEDDGDSSGGSSNGANNSSKNVRRWFL